jgi:hypothetical protein
LVPRNPTAPGSQGDSSVARFPPLPAIPPAPQQPPDERQARAGQVIGGLASAVETEMQLAGPNLTTGYYASSIDLGRLQAELGKGVARLTAAQLEERWDEVFSWMRRLLRSWVQRCKLVKIDRQELGIRVELETQDDHGYYRYGFDVFPRKP